MHVHAYLECEVMVSPHNFTSNNGTLSKELPDFSDGSCWEIIIIKQIHTFNSNKLFEQQRFDLGCLSLYQVKWQDESQPIYSNLSLLPERPGRSTWNGGVWMPD